MRLLAPLHRTASDVLLLPKTEKWANERSWGGGVVTWRSDFRGHVMDSIKSKHTTSWQRLNNGLSLLHLFTGFHRGRKQLLRLCVRIKVKINKNLRSKWEPRERSLFKHTSILPREPHGCSKTALLWETLRGHRSNLWKTIIGQLRYAIIRQYSPPSKHLTLLNSDFWGPGKPFPWQQTQYCIFM